MARSLSIVWHEDASEFEVRYKAEPDLQRRTRLHALWLVRLGHTVQSAASVVGIHLRTLQQWLAWYRQGGLSAVLAHRHGGHAGRVSRLSAPEEATLKTIAAAGPDRQHLGWRSMGANPLWCDLYLLGDAHGVCPFGLKEKSPSTAIPQGLRPSAARLEKRGLTACLRAVCCPDGQHLFWGDEMRVGLIGCVRRVWAPVGVKVVQTVEYTRAWAYLHLAVNGPERQTDVDLDGAYQRRIHRAPWSNSGADDGSSFSSGIAPEATEALYMIPYGSSALSNPPYSPELNPPERVFEYLRAAVGRQSIRHVGREKKRLSRPS